MTLESLSRAFSGQLTYDADHERDLDRLLALCLGNITTDRRASREAHLNALGMALIAFKHRNLPEYHARAQSGLADALAWKAKGISKGRRYGIAGLAISEWVIDQCNQCLGSRIVTDVNGVQRACLLCSGSGKRRYSDEERASILGASGGRYNSAVEIAHSVIGLAVRLAYEFGNKMLRGHG